MNPSPGQGGPSQQKKPLPTPPATSQSKLKGAKSFFQKFKKKFSKKAGPPPETSAPQQPFVAHRTYAFVDPSQLRDSPSPNYKFDYITSSPRSSFTPPSPSWLSRNVPLSPPTRTIHNSYTEFTGSHRGNNSSALNSTFLPPELTGRPPHRNRRRGPTAEASSPLLAPTSPPLPTTSQYTPPPSPPSHRHYRPPTPPKGRRRRRISTPDESILGNLASLHPTHHKRYNSSPPHRQPFPSSSVRNLPVRTKGYQFV